MTLGADPITVAIGDANHELRPSLRAALALARIHGDPASLARKVDGGSIAAIRDVLVHAGDRELVDALDTLPIAGVLAALKGPALRFVPALATPPDPDAKPTDKASAKPLTYAEHFEHLYGLATGWLGWSAPEAWAATPAEIVMAYRARVALLQAMFGGGGKPKRGDAKDRADLSLDQRARLAFASFATRKVKRGGNA